MGAAKGQVVLVEGPKINVSVWTLWSLLKAILFFFLISFFSYFYLKFRKQKFFLEIFLNNHNYEKIVENSVWALSRGKVVVCQRGGLRATHRPQIVVRTVIQRSWVCTQHLKREKRVRHHWQNSTKNSIL